MRPSTPRGNCSSTMSAGSARCRRFGWAANRTACCRRSAWRAGGQAARRSGPLGARRSAAQARSGMARHHRRRGGEGSAARRPARRGPRPGTAEYPCQRRTIRQFPTAAHAWRRVLRALTPLVGNLDPAGTTLADAATRLVGTAAAPVRLASFQWETRTRLIRPAAVIGVALSDTDPLPPGTAAGDNYLHYLATRGERTSPYTGPGANSLLFGLRCTRVRWPTRRPGFDSLGSSTWSAPRQRSNPTSSTPPP